jgi:mannose-6-phosphate isomerase
MDIIEITGSIKEYEWGNTDYIAALLGLKENSTRRAELWFSTHPDGPSTVVETGELLSELLARESLFWLGEEHLSVYGSTLPLLLKVLAIDRPLSLQVHPDAEQARHGWSAERAIRKSLPKELWNYKDENGKPEMAWALTPVTVMCGFRELEEVQNYLRRFLPQGYDRYFSFLDQGGESDELLMQVFKTIYTMGYDERHALIEEYLTTLRSAKGMTLRKGEFLQPKGIVLELSATYPDDPGLFAPFLLNVLHLDPGEAIYLGPRTLHAYVKGNLIELMGASDNVLRAGLTPKKIDLNELFKVMEISSKQVGRAPILVGSSGRKHVLTPTEDFHLMVMESGRYVIKDRRSIELLFVVEGSATVEVNGVTRTLKKGSCHAIAAGIETYTVSVDGLLFGSDVPR